MQISPILKKSVCVYEKETLGLMLRIPFGKNRDLMVNQEAEGSFFSGALDTSGYANYINRLDALGVVHIAA